MPSTRRSESISYSSRRESSAHHSTGSYTRQTTTHYVHTSMSSTVGLAGSHPGSDSSARTISHRSRHDDRRDRSPRHEGSSITRHDYDRTGSRNSTIRTQASSGTHHHTRRYEQNPQHPADRSQMESFVYDTSIQDVLVRRQYGFQGSDRVGDARRDIRKFEEKFKRHEEKIKRHEDGKKR